MKSREIAIIGAGPAGVAAAIQLERQGIHPRLFECGAVGGLLRNAHLVENYPGFPNGIAGADLVPLFEAQAARHRVAITNDEIRRLDFVDDFFEFEGRSRTYVAETVILASGTRPLPLTDFEIPASVRERVFYEVYPLLSETGKRVAMVGAGDAAFDYALSLARENEVIILNRGTRRRCLPLLWERTQLNERIEYCEDTAISSIEQLDSGGLRLVCTTTTLPGGQSTLDADYLVGAIGREPRLDYLSDGVRERLPELEQAGRLYRVGDVRNGRFRQTAIAVGDGIAAAMTIHQRREQGCSQS